MKTILVTQRVDEPAGRGERRDGLDQRWVALILAAGLEPVLVPNNLEWARRYAETGTMDGLLLTGGNSLVVCGGQAPERDETEYLLLNTALERRVPVLGVCRGMQVILDRFGTHLHPVEGHVAARQTIEIEGVQVTVNSYHDWGATELPADLEPWARAADGVIKAVRHRELPVEGIMWHPERLAPFRSEDVDLLRRVFCAEVIQ